MTRVVEGLVAAAMLGFGANAQAMPTKAEIDTAKSDINELIAEDIAAYNKKSKKAEDVGDMSVKYAQVAKTEAAKFILLKGAFVYYVRGAAYDKAADAVNALREAIPDIPPEVLEEIIRKNTARVTAKKAPRLYAMYQTVQVQMAAVKTAKIMAAKKPKDEAEICKLAEAQALSGDWKAALGTFSQLGTKAGVIAKSESDDKDLLTVADFWWDYVSYLGKEDADAFKTHAAEIYRRCLTDGLVDGLKKNIVEKRLKRVGDVPVAAQTAFKETGSKLKEAAKSTAAATTSAEYGFKDSKMFCVIDVAKGPKAKRYAVTYMDETPSGGWTLEEKTKKIVLRKVKAGSDPFGRYTISKDYYIGVFEVSQEQWERVMGSNPSENKCEHLPVTMISTVDVRGVQGGNKTGNAGFVGALSERTGIAGFDLPTEAQWDYANRVGAVSKIDDRIWERCRDSGNSLLGADPIGDISGKAVANCKWKKGDQKIAHAGTNLTNPVGDRGFRIVLNLK